jgi:hypothetical protein
MAATGTSFGRSRTQPPDAPVRPRRHPPTWAAKAWLVVLGLAAIAIGGHDLLVATEITVRLWGTLVLGAGLVLVAGAGGLQRDTPPARALAMVAALLGVALGAMTFLAQVVSDEPDVRLLLWAAIMALSGASVAVVRRVTPAEERGAGVWSRLPVLKSVVSVGVLISLGQFWYTAIYVPTTAPANLTLEPKLTQAEQGDHVVLQGSVTIRNTSGTRVNVLASYLDVSASDAALAPDGVQSFDADVVDGHRGAQLLANRYLQNPPATSVLHGAPVRDGTYFEPGETITQTFLAWVPKGSFTLAAVEVQMTIARAQALALETSRPERRTSGGRTVIVTPIPESGWLRRITRGDRFVHVEYDDRHLNTYPLVKLTPGRHRAPADFDGRMWRLYGVSTVRADALVSITPPAAARR